MAKEVILTKEGKEELEQRLDYLIKVKRAEMAERVKLAREFGDISENAEYDAAKDEQGMVEDEIKKLENMLNHAKIIENKTSDAIVSIGSYVTVKDIEVDKVFDYQLVGSAEANFKKGRISNESPLGEAILNKQAGDIVTVIAPVGELKFEIISVGKKK